MQKLRFKIVDGHAEIYAPLKATGKWALLGTCHVATVKLIKADGIRKHLHLINVR